MYSNKASTMSRRSSSKQEKVLKSKTGKKNKKLSLSWEYFTQWSVANENYEDYYGIVEWCKTKCSDRINNVDKVSKKSNKKFGKLPNCCEDCTKTFCSAINNKQNFVDNSLENYRKKSKDIDKPKTVVSKNLSSSALTRSSSRFKSANEKDKLGTRNSPQIIKNSESISKLPSETKSANIISQQKYQSHSTTAIKGSRSTTTQSKSLERKLSLPPFLVKNNVDNKSELNRKKREWTANVEAELLQLYQNCPPNMEPEKDWTISCWQQQDSCISSYSRVEKHDETPSYMLAMSNLFRKRRQLQEKQSRFKINTLNRSNKYIEGKLLNFDKKNDVVLKEVPSTPKLRPRINRKRVKSTENKDNQSLFAKSDKDVNQKVPELTTNTLPYFIQTPNHNHPLISIKFSV